jgi:GT2 family glycosyltransferase
VIDLSVVIVSWRARDLLFACLESLDRQVRARREPDRIEIEVFVVDNASGDGTPDAVRERFPWVQVIALARNVGFAAGNNVALAKIAGRHALLLNNDTEVLPGALERCVRFLDEHPDVGVVGPQLLNPDGSKQNSVHNYPSLATELLPKGLLETLLPRRFPSKRYPHDGPVDVEAVLGACLFVRREVLDRVGLMPEDYFFFLEETDWCWRIREAGWRVVHLPDARVVHVHGATTKKRVPGRTRIEYHRSLYRFFRKRRGAAQAAAVGALRFAKSALYALVLLPGAVWSRAGRERWRSRSAVLWWHLRGCPASAGLARDGGDTA